MKKITIILAIFVFLSSWMSAFGQETQMEKLTNALKAAGLEMQGSCPNLFIKPGPQMPCVVLQKEDGRYYVYIDYAPDEEGNLITTILAIFKVTAEGQVENLYSAFDNTAPPPAMPQKEPKTPAGKSEQEI